MNIIDEYLKEIPISYEDNESDVKAMLNHYAKTL